MYPLWFCGAGGKQADNNADGEKQVFVVHMAHYSLGCGYALVVTKRVLCQGSIFYIKYKTR